MLKLCAAGLVGCRRRVHAARCRHADTGTLLTRAVLQAKSEAGTCSPRVCPQKKAADLYTGCLKPLLAQLRLPWAEEQRANCLPCSPLGHVLWAAEQSDSHALRLAPHIPLLLSCFLAVER